jgi:hypothetical protein
MFSRCFFKLVFLVTYSKKTRKIKLKGKKMKERVEQCPYAITKTKHEFRLILQFCAHAQIRTIVVALTCPFLSHAFSEYTLRTHMNRPAIGKLTLTSLRPCLDPFRGPARSVYNPFTKPLLLFTYIYPPLLFLRF